MKKFVILTMTFAFANLAHAGDNPAAKPLERDIKRHKQFLEIVKQGNPDVVFLGDSITQGWEGNGKNAWQKHFAPLKAINLGIGGDQTGHVLWRLTEGGEFETIRPKVVVLMIGTNNTGNKEHTAERIAGAISEIVKTIHKKSPETKVLLLAVFPRANKAGELNTKIPEINKIIAKLDDGGKTVKYLDIGDKFLVDGKMAKGVMYDYLHLSTRGYEIWAEAIMPTLNEMLGRKE